MTLEDIFLKITMGDNVVIKTKKAADAKTDEAASSDKEDTADGDEVTETAEKDESKEDNE